MDKISELINKRNVFGWKDINEFIKLKGSLFVKKTNNKYYSDDYAFNDIIRTNCFYSQDKKIYTWTKRDNKLVNTDVYIYGNPYTSYDF